MTATDALAAHAVTTRIRNGRWRGVILPFTAFTLIWSSTWLVVRFQLGVVPAQWSVTYRFIIATAAMAGLATFQGHSLRPDRQLLKAALVIGITQFCINFNGVYLAERFITSGLVATVFALSLVPSSLFAWGMLGQRPSGRFLAGGLVATVGIALLFIHELNDNPAFQDHIGIGILLTGAALLGACFASVYQALDHGKRRPIPVLLTWSMGVGSLADGILAFVITGAPVFDPRPAYWVGLAYLAIFASVVTFSLYYPVVRRIGAGRAAYSSILIPIIAMGLSTAFEAYRWTQLAAAGVVLALLGMVLALSGSSRAERV